jgi:hypothetical protein
MRIFATITSGARRDSAASLASYTDAMEDMPGVVDAPSHRRAQHDD